MPVMKRHSRRRRTDSRNRPGIALVITLSILVLLTLVVSKAFQDTALEIKMVRHDENRFLAEHVNRSFFKVFLNAVKTMGANKAHRFIATTLPPGLPVPILPEDEDGFLLNPEIIPMDHYINLNVNYGSTITGAKGPIVRDLVKNMINFQTGRDQPPQHEIYGFVGAVADFIDSDNPETDISAHFLRGQESYPNAVPYFTVKNREIDLLSELKLLPSLHRLNLKNKDINAMNLPFTIYNIDEVEQYLAMMQGVSAGISANDPCAYDDLYRSNKAKNIAKMVTDKYNSADLFFKNPLRNDNTWQDLIRADFSFIQEASTKMGNFFSARSEYIRIRYQILYSEVTISTEAILKLEYGGKNDTDIPTAIRIMYYKTR
ncbi:hypothetical protein CHS0354_018451 [Potamilus streckersoni]|uniref:Type II secretion system protein K n=1 Tax=Potamilus streckersoni TaxID=2493646 RepID=A0AAE0WAW7_9BIVA|nr:hypothetical protein CHS0354_018451 [Potamilus streckersoni]